MLYRLSLVLALLLLLAGLTGASNASAAAIAPQGVEQSVSAQYTPYCYAWPVPGSALYVRYYNGNRAVAFTTGTIDDPNGITYQCQGGNWVSITFWRQPGGQYWIPQESPWQQPQQPRPWWRPWR